MLSAVTNRLSMAVNGTTGRSIFSMLASVAPAAAERIALEMWAHPHRRREPRPPEVPGLPAHRFYLSVGLERLALWDWGEGPTVLLVHGWNGHAGQMARFVAPLVAAGHHVVAFDMPAHGLSTGTRTNLIAMTDAVLAVAHRLGPIHGVIAHSLGATATTLAIARHLGGVRSALIAPAAEPRFFLRAFTAGLGLPPARTDGVIALAHQELGDLDALDLRRRASSLAAPVLILHDPADREVPFAHGADIAAAWPGARLTPLTGLGHNRPLADPATIARAVDFIAARRADETAAPRAA
jgi:pimeloyl-ACP methyl ester carboxylesterase